MPRESVFYNTVVVNAYEYYKLSFPTESLVKKETKQKLIGRER
jgi:hypothetical protein